MIPHNRPSLGREELAAVARVLESGWVAQDSEVEAFENEFCEFLSLPPGHAVAVSSGTAALFLALHVLGARGKTVALPVYSCSALSNAAALAGARMTFLDVAPDQPNVAGAQISGAAADIVVAAHMFGIPIDLPSKSSPIIVEDCAQAVGARYDDGRPVGFRGSIATFSFYATKLMTSGGQGGMVVSRDLGLAAAARDYRQFDQRHDRIPRFNFQMTDLQAAIGRVQLKRLPQLLARRARIFERYKATGITLADSPVAAAAPVRFRAVMRHDKPEDVIQTLAAQGVTAIVPVEDWELLDSPEAYPNARRFARTSVSLPIHPHLEDDQIDRIADALCNLAG
jgi:perosamine synthetase